MRLWTTAACALLAACGNPAKDDRAAAPVVNSQGYLAKVRALPDGLLRGVLYRAILDGGADCPKVTNAARQPDQNGRAVWLATCSNGGRWTIAIGDDGIAQARPSAKATG